MGKIVLFVGLLFSMMPFHVAAQNTRGKLLSSFSRKREIPVP